MKTAKLQGYSAQRHQPRLPALQPHGALTRSRCLLLSPPHVVGLNGAPGAAVSGPAPGWRAQQPVTRLHAPSASSAAWSSSTDDGADLGPPSAFQAAFGSYQRFMGLAGKFMPMVGLFFLLAFVNTILDSLKDTLVITAVGGGAQVIPYLTVYAVLPSSLLFLVTYSLASQHMTRAALFNAIVTGFMVFFTLFAFVLYPNHNTLHPHVMADQLAKLMPQGVEGLVGMFRNWTFTAFFCMSELWGDVCLGLLFWGLANDTTKLADAPTLYPLFGLGANVAQALGGTVLKVFSGMTGDKASGMGDFATQMQSLMLVVVGFMVSALALHAYIDRKHEALRTGKKARAEARAQAAAAARAEAVVDAVEQRRTSHAEASSSNSNAAGNGNGAAVGNGFGSGPLNANGVMGQRSQQQQEGLAAEAGAHQGQASKVHGSQSKSKVKEEVKKEKPSVGEIFKVLAASVPIRCLAIMSLSQGLCTSLMEFAWKSHIGLLFPSPPQFTAFLGDVSMWQGLVTGFLMVLSPAMFERMGWSGVAGATPRVLLLGGSVFFSACLLYQFLFATHAAESLVHAAASLAAGAGSAAQEGLAAGAASLTAGTGGLVLQGLVYGGALLYVFSKSAKFSLFKPAEEMVYISLDEEGRTKGKAAIDVVGSQAGKSTGSMMQQALLLMSGGAIAGIIPIMAVVYFAMAQGWLRSVSTLAAHADYGRPESVHESVAHMQASTMSSDDEEDYPGGGASGPWKPVGAAPDGAPPTGLAGPSGSASGTAVNGVRPQGQVPHNGVYAPAAASTNGVHVQAGVNGVYAPSTNGLHGAGSGSSQEHVGGVGSWQGRGNGVSTSARLNGHHSGLAAVSSTGNAHHSQAAGSSTGNSAVSSWGPHQQGNGSSSHSQPRLSGNGASAGKEGSPPPTVRYVNGEEVTVTFTFPESATAAGRNSVGWDAKGPNV